MIMIIITIIIITIINLVLNTGRNPVSYTHLRAHETRHDLVCRLLLEKKKKKRRGKKLTVANWVFAQTTHVDAAICGLACRVVFGR